MLFRDAEGLHLFLGRGESGQLPQSTHIHLCLPIRVSVCLMRLHKRIQNIQASVNVSSARGVAILYINFIYRPEYLLSWVKKKKV